MPIAGIGDVGTTAPAVGASVGSGLLTAGAIAGGPTNPVGIGLMIAGGAVMLGSSLLHVFGVGVRNPYEDKDVQTLNQLEQQLQAINAQWVVSTHDTTSQQQALTAIDYLLQQLTILCSDPNLGSSWAQGCINDRKRGGKWDWYAMYRDPIANAQLTDSGTVNGTLTQLVGGSNVIYVAAGLALVGLFLASKD